MEKTKLLGLVTRHIALSQEQAVVDFGGCVIGSHMVPLSLFSVLEPEPHLWDHLL
jgi:hypothetical protein